MLKIGHQNARPIFSANGSSAFPRNFAPISFQNVRLCRCGYGLMVTLYAEWLHKTDTSDA